jgi:hypothetical protein
MAEGGGQGRLEGQGQETRKARGERERDRGEREREQSCGLRRLRQEFDGEDPALPDVRHMLDHTTERLVDLHKDAQIYAEPFELAEPSEEDVATMRDQVERELDGLSR